MEKEEKKVTSKKKSTGSTSASKSSKVGTKKSTATKSNRGRRKTTEVVEVKKQEEVVEVKTVDEKVEAKANNKEIIRFAIVLGVLAVFIGISFFLGLKDKGDQQRYQSHVGINEVSVSDYMNIISEDGISLIYIASTSCGYCQMFGPILSEVLEEYKIGVEYVNIAGISTQEEWDTFYNSNEFLAAGEWGTPTLIIYKDGKILNINSGYVEKDALVSFLVENGLVSE